MGEQERGALRTCGSVLLLLTCVPAQESTERWAGTVFLSPENRLDFTVRFASRDGKPGARLDIPAQKLRDARMRQVEIAGNRRRFTLGPPNPKRRWAIFDVRVSPGGKTAAGVMLQLGREYSVGMQRLDADQPDRAGCVGDLPVDRHAVRWTGTIDLGAGRSLALSTRLVGAAQGAPDSGSILIPTQKVAAELHDVSIAGKRIAFTFRPGGEATWARFELHPSADGRSAKGEMHQVGKVFPVTVRRVAAERRAAPPRRPQHPKPPYPYATREVRIENEAAGVTLAGTLSVPKGPGPHPAALLLSGSGPQDRDGTMVGHKPFLVIADHLTRHGIAVLRVDDRGVGRSTGDRTATTTADYAGDARACLSFLTRQPEVDKRRAGLIGHSEGAWIAIMVAGVPAAEGGRRAGVAWMVLLGGPGESGREIVEYQNSEMGVSKGAEKSLVDAARAAAARVIDLIVDDASVAELRKAVVESCRARERLGVPMTTSIVQQSFAQWTRPWNRFFVAYDPQADLQRIRVPVLTLNGELDRQIRAATNLPKLRSALEKGGNPDVTTVSLPRLNHLFQAAVTGSMDEYPLIDETFSQGALDRMTKWIRRHTALTPR